VLWSRHEIARLPSAFKRIHHAQTGMLRLHCQVLFEPDQSQALLIYTASPGSEDDRQLRTLSRLLADG